MIHQPFTATSHQMWATASNLKNPELHCHIYAPELYLYRLFVDSGHLATYNSPLLLFLEDLLNTLEFNFTV